MAGLLEICCYTVEDARIAQGCGADRIELCAGRPEGGTTPSIGLLEQALSQIEIPIFAMVRPRGGDFVFDADEFRAMIRDIEAIAGLGYAGVVLGILNPTATVDVGRTRELISIGRAINPALGVTFHRAFDVAADPLAAYRDIASTGADRLLTSGQQPLAEQGLELIGQLIELQADGPRVMPGSGVRPHNVRTFLDAGAHEVHSTASISGGTGVDAASVSAMVEIVHEP